MKLSYLKIKNPDVKSGIRPERQCFKPKADFIGIDEAGRGPLAGPIVVAGAAYHSPKLKIKNLKPGDLKDSKKLSSKKREEWYRFLTKYPDLRFAVCAVRPATIDRINIHQAALLGVKRVLKKIGNKESRIFLDGSLYAPKSFSYQKTIIKGDASHPLIMAASIIAKVTRDRLMRRLHKKYPEYDFDVHKGYGTKKHREAIKKNGLSAVHRKSFRFGN